ncbi:MAG: hypothetical protein OXI01_22430 [Albidovulum sp.]|nr:hypothetical protein [Albidovulum sp.]
MAEVELGSDLLAVATPGSEEDRIPLLARALARLPGSTGRRSSFGFLLRNPDGAYGAKALGAILNGLRRRLDAKS